jgi:glycosyltransferase involved in cell wall biosynthesis
VVVPTHNRASSLRHTIASLQQQNLSSDDYEIIVVDNASTDDTKIVVEEANHNGPKEVRYVYEGQLGLHNARHAGARAAQAAILAFTDDDAICERDWLEQLLACYNDPLVGCAGGKILPKWEALPPAWILRYPGALALLDRGDEVKELRWPEDIYGVNFSIRREVLFDLGGFNPESFGDIWLGDGETGLLRKVYTAGWKVIYNPKAVVWHVIPQTRLTLEYMKRRFANQGAAASYSVYQSKHPPRVLLGFRSLVFLIAACEYKIINLVAKAMHSEIYYISALRAVYCLSRARYEFKLIFDGWLRALATRCDWINDSVESIGPERVLVD